MRIWYEWIFLMTTCRSLTHSPNSISLSAANLVQKLAWHSCMYFPFSFSGRKPKNKIKDLVAFVVSACPTEHTSGKSSRYSSCWTGRRTGSGYYVAIVTLARPRNRATQLFVRLLDPPLISFTYRANFCAWHPTQNRKKHVSAVKDLHTNWQIYCHQRRQSDWWCCVYLCLYCLCLS